MKYLKILASASLSIGIALSASSVSAQVHRGGDLAATLDIEIASLDPLYGSAVSYDRTTLNLFYDNLYILDADGQFMPRLATEWTVAEDGLSISFELRHDVKFHDGLPFDSAAVVANIDRIISNRDESRSAKLASSIASADAIDEDTVRINFERKSGSILSILATEAAMMVSPAAMDDPAKLRRNPVGTGPFLLEEWQGGFQLKVVANPEYWRKDESGAALPYLDSVTLRFIADTSVAIVEAQSGAVQITDRIQARDFGRIEAMEGLSLNPIQGQITQFLVFNNSGSPFDENLALRQAVVAAIDPSRVEKIISEGRGRVNPTWVPHTAWEFTTDLPTAIFDADLARELYAKSGHSKPLAMSIIQRDPDTQIAQIVQAMLAQAGIPMEIEVLEREAWLAKTRSRNHEIALLRSTAPLADPDMRFSGYYLPESGGNYSAIRDEDLIQMVRDAEAETDFDSRRAIYHDIQSKLLENAYEVYLSARPAAEVLNDQVNGFRTELVGSWLLDEVWLAQ